MQEDELTKKHQAELFEVEQRQFRERSELQERQRAALKQLKRQRQELFEADLVDLGVVHVAGTPIPGTRFDDEKPGNRHFFVYRLQEGERLIDVMEGLPPPYLVATQHEGNSLIKEKRRNGIGFDLLACGQGFIYVSGYPTMMFEGRRGQQQELRRYFLRTARTNDEIALLIVKDV